MTKSFTHIHPSICLTNVLVVRHGLFSHRSLRRDLNFFLNIRHTDERKRVMETHFFCRS